MRLKTLVSGLCVAGALCGGAYLGREQHKKVQNLNNENIELKAKLSTMEKDMFELKKENVLATEFPLQLDTLEKTPVGKRNPQFLERVVTNAAKLDSINKTDRHMEKVVDNLSTKEFGAMCLERGTKTASKIANYFIESSKEIKFKR